MSCVGWRYTPVVVSAARLRAEAEAREKAAARRAEQARQRAAEAARLAARRAEERERLALRRAEEERQRADRTRQRKASEAERDRQRIGERRQAVLTELGALRTLIDDARRRGTGSVGGGLSALERQLVDLQTTAAQGPVAELSACRAAGQLLRMDILELTSGAAAAPGGAGSVGGGRPGVVSALRAQLARIGPDGLEACQEEYGRCETLLRDLEAAAGATETIRFDSLIGTVEHALRRLALLAETAAEAARTQRLAREREAAEAEAAAAAAEMAAEAEREERLVRQEARDRLSVIRGQARAVLADAAGLRESAVGAALGKALRMTEQAVEAGPSARALEFLAALERLVAASEIRLDECVLAAERRAQLAEAVKQAMAGEGLFFLGSAEQDGRLVLQFERAGGATYTAEIGESAETRGLLLAYSVIGEHKAAVSGYADAQVAERVEQVLMNVNAALAPHGFEADRMSPVSGESHEEGHSHDHGGHQRRDHTPNREGRSGRR